MARRLPGKMLLKFDGGPMSMESGSDGKHRWTYLPTMGQYTLTDGAATDVDRAGGLMPDFYGNSISPAEGAHFLNDETITVTGTSVKCRVIETTVSVDTAMSMVRGPDTLWVDPRRDMIVRSHHRMTVSRGPNSMTNYTRVTFTKIETAKPPPDDLFVFNPPAGAEKVAVLGVAAPKAATWVGKPAPVFVLPDIHGRKHALKNYRGKVVLLDFWATWCVPCQVEAPTIEKIYKKYGKEKVVVLAVSGESIDKIKTFIKKNGYTFAALHDADGATMNAYKITTIPQLFIIGKEGTVVAHLVGLHDEPGILKALGKAGIQ